MSAPERNGTSIVWMRRDLRLADHAALFEAAIRSAHVVCAFVLDPVLLRGPRMGPPIVQFFFSSLGVLREHLRRAQSDLALLEGDFATELVALAARTGATAVFYNVDYDPDMIARDERVIAALRAAGLDVHGFTDHVYTAAGDIVQTSGKPYTIYTPFRKRWEAVIAQTPRRTYASVTAIEGKLLDAQRIGATRDIPQPEEFGYVSNPNVCVGGIDAAEVLLTAFLAGPVNTYLHDRNAPAIAGTSGLSPHLRAGTIGIRTCVNRALQARAMRSKEHAHHVDSWIGELIWRDFYQHLLTHFPRIAHEPFVENAKDIVYQYDAAHYKAWCEGRTGYPIVDAAMVQMNTTGWMHNRLRMIVASFLTKHLLVDYHEGERYFEQHLVDADLAANNGGWQWSASTGTDAAPYFRVFNPTLQGKTFDPEGTFVRSQLSVLRNVPAEFIHEPWLMPPIVAAEAGCIIGTDYPAPIIDHATARARAIEVYGAALKRP
jgi:deoxyribodipyrimidine photo-lyase